MATVLAEPKLAPTEATAEQRLVLYNVPWSTYETLLNLFEQHPSLRMNYDSGRLELMTVSQLHEMLKKLLARLFEALTEELNIDVLSLGNLTNKRKDLEKGLEPDDSWYIQHEAQMRNKEIDWEVDPPPDLFIEAEVSQSFVSRMTICAKLGVPEIWRYNGRQIRFFSLGDDGAYHEIELSVAIPQLRPEHLQPFLDQRGELSETQLVKSFRQWVRENLVDAGNGASE